MMAAAVRAASLFVMAPALALQHHRSMAAARHLCANTFLRVQGSSVSICALVLDLCGNVLRSLRHMSRALLQRLQAVVIPVSRRGGLDRRDQQDVPKHGCPLPRGARATGTHTLAAVLESCTCGAAWDRSDSSVCVCVCACCPRAGLA